MPLHSPQAWNGSLQKYRLPESLMMRAGVMNVLGRNVHVDVKFEFIRKSNDCPRLANAMDRVKHTVLIGPAMDPNKDAITPSNALTGTPSRDLPL